MLLDKVNCKIVTNEIKWLRTSNHENIVKFFAQTADIHNIFIIMEFCKYGSLKLLQQERIQITEHECRYFMKNIFSGLEYLHNKQIIHRDLKLANIFLYDNLKAKIGDFGLAIGVSANGELEQIACGTTNYFAPEIVTRIGYSIEVDVWSVGVIMYILLVGKLPFGAKDLPKVYNKIENCLYRFVRLFVFFFHQMRFSFSSLYLYNVISLSLSFPFQSSFMS